MPKFADESCAGIWKLPKELSGCGGGGSINGPGPGGGGNAGGDVGGEILLLLFVGSCLSLNLFSRFLIAKSPGGPGACFIRSLAKTFFPTSSSLSRAPTIGFSESKVKISSKTSSRGFCHLKIFLLIGSSFCRKLALLILSFVT